MNNHIIKVDGFIEFNKTDDIVSDMKFIIDSSQKSAYPAINTNLIYRNQLIGYRIVQEELNGDNRAKYGDEVIKNLSKNSTREYGKGFTKSNLYSFYKFYTMYPNIFQTVSEKSPIDFLSWSHYQVVTQVKDSVAREWYEKEAKEQT